MGLQAGERLGAYEILAALGAGGMGEVYRARDTKLGRDVALKILPESFASDADRVARFKREAQALASINHPHIAAIYGLEESPSSSGSGPALEFLVLELVDGETLAQRLAVRGAKPGHQSPASSHRSPRRGLPLEDALGIARQIAEALVAAHEQGIVHRDLKPANVMLRRDGLVKVLDFGLAKVAAMPDGPEGPVHTDAGTVVRHGATTLGAVMGTRGYMSPEQARGEPVDARTDVFNLGVLLREIAPAAPPDLQRIAAKAVRPNRDERYQSMREMAVDLKSCQRALESGTDPSAAVPRRRPIAGAAALAAVAVLAVGAGAFYATRPGPAIDSVAVLPFANAGGDPNVEYLSDGIAESLINSLAQLPHLRVMSRNSAFRFKGQASDPQAVAKTLGVRAVLTGRVVQRGDSLAVSVELVDARDNSQIWGQQYNRRVADVFTVQEEMAREITDKLRIKLTGEKLQQLAKRPTENLKAFQFYMQGRSYVQRRTREDLLTAIDYDKKAIAEDAGYALAYAGLTEAYTVLTARGYIPPREGRRLAQDAGRKALALDATLAEAHVAVSQPSVLLIPYDFAFVERELRRAIELSPSQATAHNNLGISFARQGRFQESQAEYVKARELDPLSPVISRGAAIPYLFGGDSARAYDWLKQAYEIGPAFNVPFEIGVFTRNRKFDEALAELAKAGVTRKNDPLLMSSTAIVYAGQGRSADARQIVKALEAMQGPELGQAHWIAKVYAALGEKEQALSLLSRGLDAGSINDFFRYEPVWDAIRDDPRFADLWKRMVVSS